MTPPIILSAKTGDDTRLVAESLAGNRDAFGQIVARYQSLVCALAFSATGSVSRSEDLAQETFLAAWQQLKALREPAKLRAWLCGIARNIIHADRRRQGREPAHRAERMDEIGELPATESPPLTQVITDEEVSLLWREVGQLPEIYREPLVLFYRQQQSAATVAAALELSEDAVMQRLSRGRKLLHERMLVFVETALDRTNPGKAFTLRVDASLTLLAVGSQLAAATSAKGMALKGAGGGLFALALPFVGMLAALGLSWSSVRQAPNPTERRFAKRWNFALWLSIGSLLLGVRGVSALSEKLDWNPRTLVAANVGIWFCYLMVLVALLVIMYRRAAAAFHSQEGVATAARPGKSTVGVIIATYVASTAWIIGLAWIMGDGGVAMLITVLTVALATWSLRRMRHLGAAAAHRLHAICHAALCGGLLLVVNLRIDRWVAPLYHVSVDEMRSLLPMATIHLLTTGLFCWAALLLMMSGRKQSTG